METKAREAKVKTKLEAAMISTVIEQTQTDRLTDHATRGL